VEQITIELQLEKNNGLIQVTLILKTSWLNFPTGHKVGSYCFLLYSVIMISVHLNEF